MLALKFIQAHQNTFKQLSIYEGILMTIAFGIGLIRGRVTPNSFGLDLVILGMILIIVAVATVSGARGHARNAKLHHASFGDIENIHQTFDAVQHDVQDAVGFFRSALTVGLLSMFIGVALFFF